MGSTTRTIKIRFDGSADGLKAEANKAAAAIGGIGDGAPRVESKIGRLGARIKTALVDHAKEAALIGGAALVAFAVKSVGAASDLNETMSKSSVIFGANARDIQQWAKGGAQAFGLSQQAALEAASSYGDMFGQLGLTAGASTTMSKKVVELAADLASFNNADITDVLDAQSGAFRGEYDALQRFIPNINAARVQQEAMAETGKKNAASLTAAEKATATYNIMLQDSSRAQGDFQRTSNGTANQTRILKAEFENFAASAGQLFLPIFTAGIRLARELLAPLSALVGGINGLDSSTKTAVGTFAAFVAAVALVRKGLIPLGGGIIQKVTAGFDQLVQKGGGVAPGAFSKTGLAAAKLKTALIGVASSVNPLTIALGLGGLAVAAYAKKKAEAAQRVQTFTQAIQQDSGALGENTRQAVVNALQSTKAFEAAKTLGLNLKTVTDAALGNSGAMGEVSGAISDVRVAFEQASGPGVEVTGNLGEQQQAAFELEKALGSTTGEVNKASGAAKDNAAAMGTAATATGKLGGAADQTAGSMQTEKTAAEQLKDALDLLNGKAISSTQTEIGFKDALAGVTTAHKENGNSLDINTDKGRKNTSAVLDAITAAETHAQAVTDQTGDVNKGSAAFRQHVTDLKATLTQLGFNKTEIARLIAAYGKVPPHVKTSAELASAAAEASAARIRAAISKIPSSKNVTVQVTQNGTVQKVQREIDSITGHVVAIQVGRIGGVGVRGNASGGFVPAEIGADRNSDSVVRALTPGELILNEQQQARLFALATGRATADASPAAGAPTATAVTVELVSSDPLLQSLLGLIDTRVTAAARTQLAGARAGTGRRR